MKTMTKEQLLSLPIGTRVIGTGEDKTRGTKVLAGVIKWDDGDSTAFGLRGVPPMTEYTVKVVK